MIKLYLYRLDNFLSKFIDESRIAKSKAISKMAYELLCDKAEEYTGQRATICKTDRGKPYIENSNLHISLSHSDNAIFFALSDMPIGVDVEAPRSFSAHAAKRLFGEREMKFISSGDESTNATILWTKREAVCKATGEGFSDWFFNCEFVDNSEQLVDSYLRNGLLLNLKTFILDSSICTAAAVSSFDNIEFFDSIL